MEKSKFKKESELPIWPKCFLNNLRRLFSKGWIIINLMTIVCTVCGVIDNKGWSSILRAKRSNDLFKSVDS